MNVRFELKGAPGYRDGVEFTPVPGLGVAEARDDRGALMIGSVEGETCIASTAHIMIVTEWAGR
jgi:hypothetical protein